MKNLLNSEHDLGLRIMTAGSVDDGKSTLIGRLLHDLNLINEDVMQDLRSASLRNGRGELDLSLYTDGLVAEREQGITIDVAYRYFRVGDRSFILCDAPGHVQYTRNMVCAASQADVALIMIDARSGGTEQTHRHLRVAQLLNVAHIVFVINKLDLVGYSQERFEKLKATFTDLLPGGHVIPVSALEGDNVVNRGTYMPWYKGKTLMELLKQLTATSRFPVDSPLRYSVQSVMRPTGKVAEHLHDFRALAGRIDSGSLRIGQPLQIVNRDEEHGAQRASAITAIYANGKEVNEAVAGQSISITLADDLDISRGDVLGETSELVELSQTLEASWCWMNDKAAVIGQRLLIKQGAKTVQARITEIISRLDLSTGVYIEDNNIAPSVAANEIARLKIALAEPLLIDSYTSLPRTGSLIAIDPQRLDTLAAAVI